MHRQASVFVILSILAAQQVRAQAADSVRCRCGTLVGGSIGVPGYEAEPVPELFTIGLNVTQVKPRRLGGDFAIGTMPRAFSAGVAVIGVRAGGVLPFALTPNATLLPSVGISLVGGAGEGGGAMLTGMNAGLAAVLWTGQSGVRTGITWHTFSTTSRAIWLIELGLVRAN